MKAVESIFNIALVALDDKFCKTVSSALASKLDMYWADCRELIVYNLIDPKKVLETCGFDYYKKQEKSVIEDCSQYRDTVISLSFDIFKEYYSFFSNSLIIYLELNKPSLSSSPSKIAFSSRDEFLNHSVDVKIKLSKKSKVQAVNQILSYLGGL